MSAMDYVTPRASPTIRELMERLGFEPDDDGTRKALLELERLRREVLQLEVSKEPATGGRQP